MSKQEKKGLVLDLRFPEFREKGEWEKKQLSELLFETKQRNRKLEYGPQDVLSVSGEYGCVNQIEFMGRSYAGVTVKDYHVVETGDIVYTKSPLKKNPFGIIKENKGKRGIVSTLYAVYRVTDFALPAFLDHYFSSDFNLNSYLQPIVNKGAKNDMKVKNSYVLSGEIPAPQKGEQKKISDCLTSVDELITAQAQKLDAVKTHKNGLMQQLFPAEGETVPKLRFPEFRDKEEWEENFIRDFGKIITGSTPSTTKPEYYGGDRLFVSPADISNQRFIEKTKTTLTELGFSQTRPVKPGSILFVCIGSTIGKIAQNRHECATNQQINAVVPSANYANAFVYYSLENNSEKISGLAGNHAVPIINKTAFGAVGIRCPKLPEQQKIANCLSSVDELITAQTQKLDALKAHKRGLIQQLFPVMDEVKS